ncbi:MAG: hypothetical protein COS95_06675, partial [Ignavibacteriales bacterium CG07_land_8_20_14_0_80_59_12]
WGLPKYNRYLTFLLDSDPDILTELLQSQFAGLALIDWAFIFKYIECLLLVSNLLPYSFEAYVRRRTEEGASAWAT